MVDYIPTMKNLLTTAAEPYGAINIDKILTAEGFKRVSTSDVNEADLVTKVLRFEAQIIEQEV